MGGQKSNGTESVHDGFKPTNSLEMAQYNSLCGIEVGNNLMVRLKKRLEALGTTLSNIGEILFLMG